MINIDNYLRLNIVDALLVLISTFLIVLLARKYFWSILKDYLDKRQEYVKAQLQEAEGRNKESESFLAESRGELTKARKQAEEILQMAEAEAREESNMIIAEARQKAQDLLERARAEIAMEKKEVAEDMKVQMGVIALAAAKEIIEKEVDEKAHRKFIEDFIHEAGGGAWGA
ncbi:F0F1 ATP synthase subunit B [Alloiococcus sp. CFN-8]|uniref:F0F1 ATP synthase subunit B n=1 Tax=Alloiococcus sp. CFN-8 TaxID=3416081 RepID=UPI003CF424B3